MLNDTAGIQMSVVRESAEFNFETESKSVNPNQKKI